MPVDELFSPQRFRLARQRRGLFAQELAARIEVTGKTVSRWENGEKEPSDKHLELVARVLEFPISFFFGDAPPSLEKAAFRALARMTARHRDMALGAGSQAVLLDGWIESNFRRPKPNVPDFRDASPEVAAEGLRAVWGLGYKPIPNLVHLLEVHGVRVYSLVHAGGGIDACSDWQGGTPFIFLNTEKTAERSRMDAGHELGHLVLHAHTAGGSSKPEEDAAQAFGAALLMPAAPFLASAPRRITVASIVDAKQRWGVSALAFVHRLHTLGRLAYWQYRQLCIQLKSNYRTEEPGPPRPRETSQVLSKVIAASSAGSVRQEIARHLRIPLRDLDEITFGLTLTAVKGGARESAKPEPTKREIRLLD